MSLLLLIMEDKIRFFALENAIKFKGKANQGAVIGRILSLNPDAKKDMKTLSKTISNIVNEVNSMSLEEQKKSFEKTTKIKKPKKVVYEGLPPLPVTTSPGSMYRLVKLPPPMFTYRIFCWSLFPPSHKSRSPSLSISPQLKLLYVMDTFDVISLSKCENVPSPLLR